MEDIREGMRDILSEDLINLGFTHENPPPHKDCGEECKVSLDDQTASANPLCAPCRSGGKKHKKCMDCWNEYIDGLILRLITNQSSQGVVRKVDRELPFQYIYEGNKIDISNEVLRSAGYVVVEPLEGK